MYQCVIKTISDPIDEIPHGVDLIESSAFDPESDQPYAYHKDYYELEMILNVIDHHKDEGVMIYVNRPPWSIPEFEKKLGMEGLCCIGDVLSDTYPVTRHYIQYLDEPQTPATNEMLFKTFRDKTKLIVDDWFYDKVTQLPAFDMKFIGLSPKICNRVIENFHRLNSNGNQFTAFAKITWYPLATLFNVLTMEY